ncbi:hypothetical protein C4561_00720 [candidate division WWE3 bacterium]|jgi:hypothetical protein|uniref:Glycoside hydrolase family 5 domain-containing protein n=1 Tax=candidate division WWE3 bacterium TaxID=2053526 RepID=A0A3A4ZFX0_UNCKA|nr:MAG: hypothetical protein C4561_00720 [candidate division WWE3 bacterium]
MLKPAIQAVLVFLFSFFILQNTSSAAISDWQKGFTIRLIDQSYSEVDVTLSELNSIGVNFVTITPGWITDSRTSSNVDRKSRTPSDSLMVYTINKAHSLGMGIMIKPHLDIKGGSWRANLNPSDKNRFFQNYSNMILHYANMAQQNNIEMLSIGAELITLTQNTANLPYWTSLIDNVRNVYSGKLTYSANADSGSYNETNLPFGNRLDLIGMSMYRPLSSTTNPTVSSMISRWESLDQTYVTPAVQRFGKPVIFTEIGYRSVDGASTRPWDYGYNANVDMQEQSDLYTAFFEYWKDKSYFAGVHFWEWEVDPNSGGPNDKNYTIENKTAENTVKNYFATADTGTSLPTPVVNTLTSSLFINLTGATGGFSTDILNISKSVYADRAYVFTDIPVEVSGAEYIKGRNSDKNINSVSYINFEISNPATIFIGYDERADTIPAWLSDWTLTTGVLKTNDTNFKIYSKSLQAGTVVLGGNMTSPASGAGSNYIVFISESASLQPATQAGTQTDTGQTQEPSPTPNPAPPQPEPDLNNVVTGTEYKIVINYPENNSVVSGEKKIKAYIEDLPLDQYKMTLNVNVLGEVEMKNDSTGNFKQLKIEFDEWLTYGTGPFDILLTAENTAGEVLDQTILTLYVKD